jgi:RNA polymerase sigma-70 factor (ECF subfamily)
MARQAERRRGRRRGHRRLPERPAGLPRALLAHFDPLFTHFARRLCRDAADDLTAEVFLTAFDRRGRYDLAHPDARPWLYGIAANLLRRHRRTEVRRLRAYAREAGRPADVPDDVDASPAA